MLRLSTPLAAFAVSISLLAGSLAPAFARDATDAERSALASAVQAFDAAMKGNDFDTVIGTIPPKVLEAMAKQYNVTADQLRAATVEQTKQVMATVTLESFGMAIDQARYLEAADGTPYAFIPTETVMTASGTKYKATGDTLALLDGDKWYLLRTSEAQQVTVLKQVYPAFAHVEFPAGTMETVKE